MTVEVMLPWRNDFFRHSTTEHPPNARIARSRATHRVRRRGMSASRTLSDRPGDSDWVYVYDQSTTS